MGGNSKKGGTQPTTESDKQEEGERGVITCNTKEREEASLNLLRDDDPDPNVWRERQFSSNAVVIRTFAFSLAGQTWNIRTGVKRFIETDVH